MRYYIHRKVGTVRTRDTEGFEAPSDTEAIVRVYTALAEWRRTRTGPVILELDSEDGRSIMLLFGEGRPVAD